MLNIFLFLILFALILSGVVIFGKFKVRKQISGEKTALLMAIFIGLIVAGWWFLTSGNRIEDRILAPLILPSPVEVLQSFPKLHFQQALVQNVVVSFKRIAMGFSLAIIAALSLGIFMGAIPAIAAFFRPVALIGSYVPIISFIPLTMAWWGGDELQKVGFLFIACFVVLLPLVIKSINNVSDSYLDVAKTKGASQWQLIKNVLVPVAMPDIWDHLRGVYGVGWGWIILAEVVNGQQGIGYLMSISERRGHTSSIFAIIIVIVVIATVCDKIWKTVGEQFFPHRASN